jgi:stage II sporulation protein D
LLLACAFVMTFFFFLSGCEKRELIEPTSGMDSPEQFWVRVLLFDNIKECTLQAETGFNAVDRTTRSSGKFERNVKPIKVDLQAGKIVIGQKIFGKDVTVKPNDPFVLSINSQRYRGNLKLLVNADGNSFDAINLVPVEAYLYGVIGAEMPNYWEPEALKAQAIAARTYCLYYKKKFGPKRNWDVSTTQATQVYRGLKAESSTVKSAVNDTSGKVLVCEHSDGKEDIFPAYYSSTCGGHTENSTYVYGGEFFEPLAGVTCPYCRKVAKMSFFYWPMVEFPVDEASSRIIKNYPNLKTLGKIKTIEPYKVNKFGRINSFKLIGENGKSGFLRGEDLRLTLDPTSKKMKSTVCQTIKIGDKFRFFSGRGYGHGVGMCQCGAEGMAREGKKVMQILGHYYPGSKIREIY